MEKLKEKMMALVPEAETEENPQFLTFIVPAENIRGLAEALRNDPELNFDYLFCLSGVDYKDHMLVVYHLKSTTLGHELVVKAKIPDRENSVIDSVWDIWRTAELHEREAYDLFGIRFTNHPDLRRLFLTDDWVGWPLRKDYVDTVNIVDR